MVIASDELPLAGGGTARVVFTGRGEAPSDDGADRGSRGRGSYGWANLGSHVGDTEAAVVAARRRLAVALGVPAGRLSFMHPDHGRGVAVVTRPTGVDPGAEQRDVDALVTALPGVGLVALAADCVPIVLVEPDAALVAVVHSGWRGVALDVLGATLDQLQRLGGRTDKVRAYLGPAICGECYPVPQERVDQVARSCPEAVAVARDGQPALDLRAGLVAALRGHGVRRPVLVGGCTREDAGLYSHRRDGRTGRQGAAVALLPHQVRGVA